MTGVKPMDFELRVDGEAQASATWLAQERWTVCGCCGRQCAKTEDEERVRGCGLCRACHARMKARRQGERR